jgi:hypothetical protein
MYQVYEGRRMPVVKAQLLWQIRRQIVGLLESAPQEKRAGMLAALRGIDLLTEDADFSPLIRFSGFLKSASI